MEQMMRSMLDLKSWYLGPVFREDDPAVEAVGDDGVPDGLGHLHIAPPLRVAAGAGHENHTLVTHI